MRRLPTIVRHGFTLIELLVVIAIIAVLMGILIPALERAREQANLARCANNLHQIGTALIIYANDNHGDFPRTTYVPGAPLSYGTGAAASDPWQAGGPAPNDVTAAVFMLVRAGLPTKVLTCPYTDVNVFEPDKAPDAVNRSNFTDYTKNLGYSYANPYPDAPVVQAGYVLTNHLSPAFPIFADLNPGTLAKKSTDNSRNHEDEGQNVLFVDGHVDFKRQATCGINEDNIFRNASDAFGSPAGPDDTVLLPPQK